jgi:hypothetical protein
MRPRSKSRVARAASPEGKAARDYMLAVKGLACCACGAAGPSEAHHPICGRYGQRKASDWDVVPLCYGCHRGPDGIHAGKASWVARWGDDRDYIAGTRAALERETPT